jgi:hypothetical protein
MLNIIDMDVQSRPLNQGSGHCVVGSLTGVMASQRAMEARDGKLTLAGNQTTSTNYARLI